MREGFAQKSSRSSLLVWTFRQDAGFSLAAFFRPSSINGGERRQRAEATPSYLPNGDSDQSNEPAAAGPLTIRTMLEHGPALSKPGGKGAILVFA
jgi:hypothetical protein